MRTRYGISPWIDLTPGSRIPEYSRLRGAHTTQVVIVGGGLTGCAAAYACALAGVKTMVIEADRVGRGSAGRSAGLLLPEPGPSFRDIEQVTPLIVASRDDERLLRREFDARAKGGAGGTWLTRKVLGKLSVPEAPAAIRTRDAFSLDPYRACLGLAAAAASRGAVIFERTPVKKVKFTRRHVDVMIEGGQVRASTVIVATGTASLEFQQLRRHFKRRESYFVLTEPLPAAIRKELGSRDTTFSDTRRPHHRVRFTADDRILVGGATQDETPERKRAPILVQRTGQLMYELLTMFPAISGL